MVNKPPSSDIVSKYSRQSKFHPSQTAVADMSFASPATHCSRGKQRKSGCKH